MFPRKMFALALLGFFTPSIFGFFLMPHGDSLQAQGVSLEAHDQGQCAVCWAFAVATLLRAAQREY